jgi:hypothetical protein
MQFISYPSSENLARLIVLPLDFAPDYTKAAVLVDRVFFPGGMYGPRYLEFNTSRQENVTWLTIPLPLFYDYYRLGTMFAGASPQNMLINLLLSGSSYTTGGLYTKFQVSAYFVNVGNDFGTVPAGITPYIAGLDVDPASTGGVYILQKLVMGQMYLNPGEVDLSDGLLVLRVERLSDDNTYVGSIFLYSLTIDMASKR